MQKKLALLLLVLLLTLTSCASTRNAAESPSMGEAAPPQAMPASGMAVDMGGSDGFEAPRESSTAGGQESAQIERLVIRNATLGIVVADPAQAMSTIGRMTETMEGYIVSSNLYKRTNENGQEYPEASINVRVPAARLIEAMDQIKALVADPRPIF